MDWWPWVISLSLFTYVLLSFRVVWWGGLIMLGSLALGAAVALVAYVAFADFSVVNVQISFALLTIVSLLCCEWVGRKLLRLA